jgi:uncharacterized Rmd1/YagE family protein
VGPSERQPLRARLDEAREIGKRSEALDRKLGMIHGSSEAMLSLIEARRPRGCGLAAVLLIAPELGARLFGLFSGR